MKIQLSHKEERAIEERLRNGENEIEFKCMEISCSDGLDYIGLIKFKLKNKEVKNE